MKTRKEVITRSALAREYGKKELESFNKWIAFLEPELQRMGPGNSNLLLPCQVEYIRKKIGAPKDRKYNYSIFAKLYGVSRPTFLNWISRFRETIDKLQPNNSHDLFPVVVDFILSKLDHFDEDDRFNTLREETRNIEEPIY